MNAETVHKTLICASVLVWFGFLKQGFERFPITRERPNQSELKVNKGRFLFQGNVLLGESVDLWGKRPKENMYPGWARDFFMGQRRGDGGMLIRYWNLAN